VCGSNLSAHSSDCPTQGPDGYLAAKPPYRAEGATGWSPRRLRRLVTLDFGYTCFICGEHWTSRGPRDAWRDARWHRTLHWNDPDYRYDMRKRGPARL
jgi:hypothetical protein